MLATTSSHEILRCKDVTQELGDAIGLLLICEKVS